MKRLLYTFWGLLLVSACSNSDDTTPGNDDRQRVNISVFAENGAISDEIKAGLYMVNYFYGEPDELLPSWNYVNNQQIVCSNGKWQSKTPIFWYDETTPADFYVYAPYKENVENANALWFNIETDQRTTEGMAKSDFLWGVSKGVQPLSGNFELTMQHHFCKMTVIVTAEASFAQENFNASNISVSIGGSKVTAEVDLQSGEIAAIGDVESVACHNNEDFSYTAILIPQQIPFSDFIKIDWDGNIYNLQSAFKLESRKEYKITVKLKKTAGGFDIGIDGWDIVDEDFGGTVG